MFSDKKMSNTRFPLLMNLLCARKPDEGMREETESPSLDGFYNPLQLKKWLKK